MTVVLIGKETLDREYVKYEIQESYKRGNAILAVNIGKIKDFNQMTTTSQSVIKIIGQNQMENICGLTKLLMANMII